MVKVENLSKAYRLTRQNKVEALKNVTMSIPKGQSVIIGGPSGSGKSTLLNLLGCLDHPSAGRIFFSGEDVTGFSEEALCRLRRATIGFVFQEFHLLSRMAAWENVSVCLVPLGVSEKERYRRASTLLDQLGLHERIFHRPEEMSGGEQQRVAFARALINDPAFILADEPTSNIDAVSAQKVLGILAGLKSKGCTIVVATHDVELFKPAHAGANTFEADSIYRLADGTIDAG
jgi:putative ABC transport system ATP-binding protein